MDILNQETIVKDKYGFIKYEIEMQNNIYLIPVDAWAFSNWKTLFDDIYFKVYGISFNYSKKSFNSFFCSLIEELRDNFNLNNSEVRQFLFFVSNHMSYLNDKNKIINVNSIKYQGEKFYVENILPIINRSKITGFNPRDLIIDSNTFDVDIDRNLNENLDKIVKQLGIPFTAYYLIKKKDINIKDCQKYIYNSIKERMEKELRYYNKNSTYLEELFWNSIYWGPYPFEDSLNKLGFPDWRTSFSWHIEKLGYNKKRWWIEGYPSREIFPCYKNYLKKKRIKK